MKVIILNRLSVLNDKNMVDNDTMYYKERNHLKQITFHIADITVFTREPSGTVVSVERNESDNNCNLKN